MQTARGASLTPSDRPDHESGQAEQPGHPEKRGQQQHPRRRGIHLGLFAAVAVLGYALDLVTKTIAVAHLKPGVPVHVVGDVLQLYIARNAGAAFSTGTSYTLVLSCVAIVAAIAVLWVARRLGSTGWSIGLGFLLAGVLGNLTDRIFREPGVLRGHVVDFLALPHWPIFNVADICINIAAAVIIIQALRGIGVDGRRHLRRRDP
ncbi:MAG: signal peptidase II [Nocardioidaceae bacterium]